MANVDMKISQLGAVASVSDADVFAGVANGVTVKTPASVLKEYIIGHTNISDIGDGTLTGAIDAINTDKNAIKDSIAPTETSLVASQDYAVGKQFYLNGVLYTCTSAIAREGAISIGTNCSASDKITEQLTSVKTALSNEVKARATLGAHQFLDIDISVLKSLNTAGTWVGNEFTHTASGVKFTVNSDLSIAVTGTASGSYGQFWLGVTPKFPANEIMNLSGVPSSASGLNVILSNAVSTTIVDSGSGADFLSNDFDATTYPNSSCYIYVDNGVTVSATVKPLIKLATDPSTTYTPYAMTNRELTEELYKSDDDPLSAFNAKVYKVGNIKVLYLDSPKSAMTQNVAYDCDILPSEFRPQNKVNDNHFIMNEREYRIKIETTGQVAITSLSALPADGIPLLQGFVTFV